MFSWYPFIILWYPADNLDVLMSGVQISSKVLPLECSPSQRDGTQPNSRWRDGEQRLFNHHLTKAHFTWCKLTQLPIPKSVIINKARAY